MASRKSSGTLRDALRLRPQNLGAYALMIQIHLDKRRHERLWIGQDDGPNRRRDG